MIDIIRGWCQQGHLLTHDEREWLGAVWEITTPAQKNTIRAVKGWGAWVWKNSHEYMKERDREQALQSRGRCSDSPQSPRERDGSRTASR